MWEWLTDNPETGEIELLAFDGQWYKYATDWQPYAPENWGVDLRIADQYVRDEAALRTNPPESFVVDRTGTFRGVTGVSFLRTLLYCRIDG